jgi:tetratricopeptide (TPR) repeat protein
MQIIRLFISSPSDAIDARKRVVRVIERLNASHSRTARFEPVLWEKSFYSAHASFQEQIVRPAECDIVVAILRWRLGTPLSQDLLTEKLQDSYSLPNEAFESGTAYEILSAIAARKSGATLPDIYVFRESGSPNPELDAPNRAEIERQWDRLKAFADSVFLTTDGYFKGAYNTFSSLDDFEARVESALKIWLEQKLLSADSKVDWPIDIKGSPFRGLSTFGAKHESVFFGRNEDCLRAIERLKSNADSGFPFLLVVGPSGAGKSSFVRASVIPKLTKPGSVNEVGFFRVALMQPLDHPDGPIASFSHRIFDNETDISTDEEGRPIALPELCMTDSDTPIKLISLFSAFSRGKHDDIDYLEMASKVCIAPILHALKLATDTERKHWNANKIKPAKLLLVIDQLDELFTSEVDDVTREVFAQILKALLQSGHIWLIATLRAELYEQFLKSPFSSFVTSGERVFNLLPLGLNAVGEAVRGPARAAGLVWQLDQAEYARLDDTIISAVDRPDLMPLLQFALERLYEQREIINEQSTLTVAAWHAFGALDGIIDNVAENKFKALSIFEQAALPRLLRILVSTNTDNIYTLRQASLDAAKIDVSSGNLIKALIEARILVTAMDADHNPTISLAHQRVIEAWGRAKEIIESSRKLLVARENLVRACSRWDAAGMRDDLLIPPGLALAEAEEAFLNIPDEFTSIEKVYLNNSSRAAQRRQRNLKSLAIGFACLFVIACGASIYSYASKVRAEKILALSTDASNKLLSDFLGKFTNMTGVTLEQREKILSITQNLQRNLLNIFPDDTIMKRSLWASLSETVEARLTAGDISGALGAANEAMSIMNNLIALNPESIDLKREHGESYDKIGRILELKGDLVGALNNYTKGMIISESLVATDPLNFAGLINLARSYESIGDVLFSQGNITQAFDAFIKDRDITQSLLSNNNDDLITKRNLAVSYTKIGDCYLEQGNTTGALQAYRSAFQLTEDISTKEPDNTDLQRNLAAIGQKIGVILLKERDFVGALKASQESLTINTKLSSSDPNNATWKHDVSVDYESIGRALEGKGDLPGALNAFHNSLLIRQELSKSDPTNTVWRHSLATAHEKVADILIKQKDYNGGITVYKSSLSEHKQLHDANPDNISWHTAMLWDNNLLGKMYSAMGNFNSALKVFQDSASIAEQLIKSKPTNARWKYELSISYEKLANVYDEKGDMNNALKYNFDCLAIRKSLLQLDSSNLQWKEALLISHYKIGFNLIKLGKFNDAINHLMEAKAGVNEITASGQPYPGDPEFLKSLDELMETLI